MNLRHVDRLEASLGIRRPTRHKPPAGEGGDPLTLLRPDDDDPLAGGYVVTLLFAVTAQLVQQGHTGKLFSGGVERKPSAHGANATPTRSTRAYEGWHACLLSWLHACTKPCRIAVLLAIHIATYIYCCIARVGVSGSYIWRSSRKPASLAGVQGFGYRLIIDIEVEPYLL